MTATHSGWKLIMKLGAWLLIAVSLNACVGVATVVGRDTWQEEALLHDGQKITVERITQPSGGYRVGYTAQSLRFTLPHTSQTVEWHDNRSEDLAHSSFLPMALDIVKGTPYLVASPMGCLPYNKWGRPNPPYVVFKYDANAWQLIPLQDLPLEIKTPNLVQSMPDFIAAKEPKRFVTAQRIAQIVAETQQPEYRSILRGAAQDGMASLCDELVNYKGNWIDPRNPFARKYIDEKLK